MFWKVLMLFCCLFHNPQRPSNKNKIQGNSVIHQFKHFGFSAKQLTRFCPFFDSCKTSGKKVLLRKKNHPDNHLQREEEEMQKLSCQNSTMAFVGRFLLIVLKRLWWLNIAAYKPLLQRKAATSPLLPSDVSVWNWLVFKIPPPIIPECRTAPS